MFNTRDGESRQHLITSTTATKNNQKNNTHAYMCSITASRAQHLKWTLAAVAFVRTERRTIFNNIQREKKVEMPLSEESRSKKKREESLYSLVQIYFITEIVCHILYYTLSVISIQYYFLCFISLFIHFVHSSHRVWVRRYWMFVC